MPNQPAKDKRVLSIQVQRNLYRKLQNLAESQNMTISDTVRRILNNAVMDTEVVSTSNEQINRENSV